MKTTDDQYQLMVKQATDLYDDECEIIQIFDSLRVSTDDISVKKAIIREAEENRTHCTRLEGLIEVLSQYPPAKFNDDASWKDFTQLFSLTYKRIAFKHAEFGYQTAITTAEAIGETRTADLLRCSLAPKEIRTHKNRIPKRI